MKSWKKVLAAVAIGSIFISGVNHVYSSKNTSSSLVQLTTTATSGSPSSGSQGGGKTGAGDGHFSPYLDVTLSGPSLQKVFQSTGQKYYILAFINGNGCNAAWGGTVLLNKTDTYLPHLDNDIQAIRSAGGDIIISFGGYNGPELATTCDSVASLQAQYQAVIDQYQVTHLDFDIENGQQGNTTTYERRDAAIAALQKANAGLKITFTLPSLTTGLLSDSLGMLNNAVGHGISFQVNVMTMDYGSPDSQMGQGSIDAANALYSQLQGIFPSSSSSQLWSMIGITPMIGHNDSAGEIFSLDDANKVLAFAQKNKLGELAFWAVSRDNGNCAGSTTASAVCSGIAQGDYAFINIFQAF